MPRSRPVLIVMSIFAGLDILLGGAVLGDFVPTAIIGLVALGSAAVQGGFAVYLSGANTLSSTVVATQQHVGAPVIAGPRAYPVTGAALSPSSTVADVVPSAAE